MSAPFFFYTDAAAVGYGRVPLLSEIRLEVNRGEILCLIGPNGAGKTTILKSITRQLKLLSGKIYLGGEDLLALRGDEAARRLAVVLTERIHTELMSCWDVVATGRYPYTGTLGLLGREDRVKIEEALELVDARDLAERDFLALSDGQRQRILLARAICQEPELILLDEPTSFLDIRHKLSFLTILRRLARERNMAVILSLHELDLAQKIADKVACVKGTGIERMGRPEDIFRGNYIEELYGVREGSFDEVFGCMELPPPQGKPEVFVICGGGSGIPVFRRLQREGVPFAAGILPENDLDFHGARSLATRVFSSPAYALVPEEICREALSFMESCRRVLCPLTVFGPGNEANGKLREEARKRGLLEERREERSSKE